jgi:hypothetical protein
MQPKARLAPPRRRRYTTRRHIHARRGGSGGLAGRCWRKERARRPSRYQQRGAGGWGILREPERER